MVIALIYSYLILRPYSSCVFNVFDGVILHFLVLVSVVPLVELFDSFNTDLLLGISFILYSNFTFLIFVTISLMIKKENIKRLPALPGYCYTRKWLQIHLRNYTEVPLNEIEESSDEDEYANIVDDINATICKM